MRLKSILAQQTWLQWGFGVIIALLLVLGHLGCISANSATGTTADTSVKTKQTSIQAENQADTSALRVEQSQLIITHTDGTVFKFVIGGANASTGSISTQGQVTKQDITAISEAVGKANSQSSINTTMIWIVAGLVILLSGLTRLIPLLKKLGIL
jgi:hypothetical protein